MVIKIKTVGGSISATIDKLQFGVPKAINISMRDYSKILVSEMRKVIRNKKKYGSETTPGRLERDMSISKAANGYTIEVYAPYAMAVDEGAVAHQILPVRGSRLKWERGGKHFARVVHHPGINRPMFFRVTAINNSIARLETKLKKNIIKVTER